ncbi:DNA glycosylase [Boeremia exigua]|uniref:DNA glycosylase n=1 Tax=Boeremia exigua TaxID=749465 RepID=UPI001E8D92E1|nr:DNA glycosylase [Boeremia exigua]KAH6629660.1 DNA glycosylase [Boeremia exigua]
MAPRRSAATARKSAATKPKPATAFERPGDPIAAALPPVRAHAAGYHFPLLVGDEGGQGALLAWFRGVEGARTMPWRKAWVDPEPQSEGIRNTLNKRAYEVWVSEIMLQQTRVSTVIPYFNGWIAKWPTVQDLARAEHEEVLAAWKGLGYYSRATRLHEGAKAVVAKPAQRMPDDVSGLLELPGIGQYTAGAISSIAFGRAEPVLDGNVARVLSRQLGLYVDVKDKKASDVLWRVADQLIKEASNHPEVEFSAVPGQWNQAMMELGSTVCTPRPKCEECPIQKTCRAFGEGTALSKKQQSSNAVPDIEDACTLCEQLDPEDLATVPEEELSDEEQKPVKKRKAPAKQKNTLSNYFAIGTPSASSNVDSEDEETLAGSKKRKASTKPTTSKSVNTYCSLFPKKVVKKKAKEEDCAVCLVELRLPDSESKWLIEQRPATGLLASLWQFPQVTLSAPDTASARKTSAQQYVSGLTAGGIDMTAARHTTSFDPLVHVFTHLRLTMHAYHFRITDKPDADALLCSGAPARKWVNTSAMDNETLSTGMRKCWALVASRS